MTIGVKRSLFSKPAWAAPAATKPDPSAESNSIFGRNVAYDDIVRAQKAERERKAAKLKARSERQKSKEESESPESKRRRISTEADTGNERDSDGEQKKKTRAKPVRRSTPTKNTTLKDGMDRSKSAQDSPRRRNDKACMSNLDVDGEDDEVIMLTPPKRKHTTLKKSTPKSKDDLDEDLSAEEDEYLRELKAKAREKARLQREQGLTTSMTPSTPLSRGSSAAVEDAIPRSGPLAQEQSGPLPSASILGRAVLAHAIAPPPEDDPEIKILIQSEIPGAKSIIVKRKASQSLQQVKEFWCRKFDLSEAVSREVFLTWRGTRLFDSTTMRGIIRGLKKDSYQKQRSVSVNLDDDDGGFDERTTKDPSGGNIMLEAMTQEIYDRRAREKERHQRQQAEEETEEDGAQADQPGPAAPDKDSGSIIIRLVAKNLEPMQLRVRPHTTVGKIMRGFGATRKIEEEKTAWLIHEGERLEPDMTVEEVGFEDEEQVEVSIRGS